MPLDTETKRLLETLAELNLKNVDKDGMVLIGPGMAIYLVTTAKRILEQNETK